MVVTIVPTTLPKIKHASFGYETLKVFLPTKNKFGKDSLPIADIEIDRNL